MKIRMNTGRHRQNDCPFSKFRRFMLEKLLLILDFANSHLLLKNYPFFRESGYEHGIRFDREWGSGKWSWSSLSDSGEIWCVVQLNERITQFEVEISQAGGQKLQKIAYTLTVNRSWEKSNKSEISLRMTLNVNSTLIYLIYRAILTWSLKTRRKKFRQTFQKSKHRKNPKVRFLRKV